ncbi:MAG: hypothetical protein IT580_21505 [Verrucomicrobiales bacterium]|nr:hypothetical protein [Verrucomicrobiales bacterium]
MKTHPTPPSHRLTRSAGRPGTLCVLAIVLGLARGLVAAPVVYTVDPDRSTISLGGKVVGVTLEAQGPGGLVTAYEGAIHADLSDTSITFTAGGTVKARNSGNWAPGTGGADGTAPANYGGKATSALANATAAARGIQFKATSGPLPLTGGSFQSAGVSFQFPDSGESVVDYVTVGFLSQKSAFKLLGLATNNVTGVATLVTSGTTETLTVPVDATLSATLLFPGDVQLVLQGQIVATRTVDSGGGGATFDSYLAAKFPGVTDPAIVGPTADGDGDGLPLFVEYAFGLNPVLSEPAFAPLKIVLAPGDTTRRVLEYARPAGLAGITYRFEVSTDAIHWTPLESTPEITPGADGRETLKWVDNAPVIPGNARLVRLTVSKP